MRRTRCLLAALLFCLALLPAARAEETAIPPALEQARQSVVHLYGIGTDSETGQRSRWTGTGFAVGTAGEDTDIFLTNWHVATGSGKFTDDQVELWLLKDDAKFDSNQVPLIGCAVKCRVLITTDGYPDVAVIQTLAPVEGYKALPLLSSRRVADGTSAYALGFPGLKATRYGADSGPEDVCITSGEVRDHLVMARAGGSKSIIHSAPIQHGFSGGPLVNAQGAVVAQNTYGFEADVSTDLFCAVYIDYGMELLDRLGLPYTTADGPSEITVLVANLLHMPDISPTLAAVIFGIGAALLLAFVLYFIKTARQAGAEVKQKIAARREKKEDRPHED